MVDAWGGSWGTSWGNSWLAAAAQEVTPERSWPSAYWPNQREANERTYRAKKRAEERQRRLRKKWMAALEDVKGPQKKKIEAKGREIRGLLSNIPESAVDTQQEYSLLGQQITEIADLIESNERKAALARMDALSERIRLIIQDEEEDLLLMAAAAA